MYHDMDQAVGRNKTRKEKRRSTNIRINKKKEHQIGLLHRTNTRLIFMFFIPVILMIMLGMISYLKSADGLNKKYESSAVTNLSMLGNYLTLGFQTVESKANILTADNDIKRYYSGYYEKSTVDKLSTFKDIKTYIFTNVMSEWYISNITIFGKCGDGITTKGSIRSINYDEFLQTDTAKRLDTDNKGVWLADHPDLDDNMGVSGDSYSLSYVRSFSYDLNNDKIGCVVLDVSNDYVINALKDLKLADGCIAGFLIGDGKEILQGSEINQFRFHDLSFYKKAIGSKDKVISQYVTYKNEQYLFLCNKLTIGNIVLCVLIPKAQIIAEADPIRNITVLIVIIACLIAILTGTLVAKDIGGVINKVNKVMQVAAVGDLTEQVKVRRKDEFHLLSIHINRMIEGVKSLIYKMTVVSDHVSVSSKNVGFYSDSMCKGSEAILTGIDNIEKGIMQQAEDSQHCLEQMVKLSEDIHHAYGRTGEIEAISEDTKDIIEQGIKMMDNLGTKVNDTTNITKVVIGDIQNLKEQSDSINSIIGTIHKIAGQTNLLSLNASIEAARAGEAGRGFAIVAEEIRGLADQSKESVSKIGRIVERIQEQTKITVDSVKQAESIVFSQEDALERSLQVFSEIKLRVDNLTLNIRQIIELMKHMEESKENTMRSIENISSTLQETTAVAGEFGTTAREQMKAVEVLNTAAKELEENSRYLQEAVNAFQLCDESGVVVK